VPGDSSNRTEESTVARDDYWPRIEDPDPVFINQMVPGKVVWVRTGKRRIRRLTVRTINLSVEGRNRGRHFITGVDFKGFCHSAWVDRVIRIDRARLPQPRELAIRRPLQLTTGSDRA
jgi:hypothetical protein